MLHMEVAIRWIHGKDPTGPEENGYDRSEDFDDGNTGLARPRNSDAPSLAGGSTWLANLSPEVVGAPAGVDKH
jgi:hypothetical protein